MKSTHYPNLRAPRHTFKAQTFYLEPLSECWSSLSSPLTPLGALLTLQTPQYLNTPSPRNPPTSQEREAFGYSLPLSGACHSREAVDTLGAV